MRHQIFGRHLGRTGAARKLLFRNLASELILHGQVTTTVAKAKAIRPLVDSLVTKAKKLTLTGRRDILGVLPREAGEMLINSVAPKFTTRDGGFSRIIHLGGRSGDNAEMVLVQWVEQIEKKSKAVKSTKSVKGRVSAKVKEKKPTSPATRLSKKTKKKDASTTRNAKK